eukprot:5254726-Prymnesium_polylepis.1
MARHLGGAVDAGGHEYAVPGVPDDGARVHARLDELVTRPAILGRGRGRGWVVKPCALAISGRGRGRR